MQKTNYVKERLSPYGCSSLLRLVLRTNVRHVQSSQTWLMSIAEHTERRLVRRKYFSFKLKGKIILGVIVLVTMFFRDSLYV